MQHWGLRARARQREDVAHDGCVEGVEGGEGGGEGEEGGAGGEVPEPAVGEAEEGGACGEGGWVGGRDHGGGEGGCWGEGEG